MATKRIDYSNSFYFGEVNAQGQPHGKGKLTFTGEWEGFSYEGDYVNGQWHGHGKYSYPDGGYYDGDYVNGQQTGKCKVLFGNGDWKGQIYEGDVVNGQWHGKGKLTYPDGSCYEGDYVNGQQTGECKFVYGSDSPWNGDIYEGDVVNGQWHGHGKYSFRDGSTYEGYFEHGFKSGDGYFSYPNGDYMDGEWSYSDYFKESYFTGSMLRHFENGDVFEGDVDNDVFLYGVYTYANGDVYEGSFDEDGKPSTAPTGEDATVKYANGTSYTGRFWSGEWSGEGTYFDKDGSEYYCEDWDGFFSASDGVKVTLTTKDARKTVGVIKNGKFIADAPKGSERAQDSGLSSASDTYEGETNESGQRHGKGTMLYASGEKYSGDWQYDDWYGWGTYYSADGKQYSGYFTSFKESRNCILVSDGNTAHGILSNGKFFAD